MAIGIDLDHDLEFPVGGILALGHDGLVPPPPNRPACVSAQPLADAAPATRSSLSGAMQTA
jgi:hypothetical protein